MRRFLILALVALVCVTGIAPAYAQGYPVIDMANLLETIYNGYQSFQQVMNTIKQLEYTYTSVKAQLQSMQNFDFSQLDSFTEAMSFADKQISSIRQMENQIKNMHVRIGKRSYNLAQMYQLPEAFANEVADDLTREMSDDEKASAWSHYGLRPANYMYLQTWKTRMTTAAQQLAGMQDSAKNKIDESSKSVDALVNGSKNSDSLVAQMQAMMRLMQEMTGRLNDIYYNQALQGQLAADSAMAGQAPPSRLTVTADDFLD